VGVVAEVRRQVADPLEVEIQLVDLVVTVDDLLGQVVVLVLQGVQPQS
jgi:hypothetical protein